MQVALSMHEVAEIDELPENHPTILLPYPPASRQLFLEQTGDGHKFLNKVKVDFIVKYRE